MKDDKEGLVDSGGESTSLFDVGERQLFQIHKFNLNVLRFFKIENQKLVECLGYETHPTLSRLITRSDDIQIDSVKEVAKLKHDVDKDEK